MDELDRCRPSYAVEMLEVIKHFFDMPNVVFVVATDTEQLQHAVKAVYGNDFNANVYLSRFFQRRCTLQEQPRLDFIQNKLINLTEEQLQKVSGLVWPEIDNDVEYLSYLIGSITDVFSLPLRETELLVDKLKAVLFSIETQKVDILLLCSLMIIHDRYFDFYQNIMDEKRPKGMNDNYHVPRTIQEILHKENFGELIELKLTPYTFFDYGYATKGNRSHLIGIENGTFSVNYSQLLSTQLESLHSVSRKNYYDEIANLVSRSGNPSAPIANFVGVELASLEQSKSDYKNWIELATSFDA
nr:P-loop NTPase fold protein [Shewanella psychrophila]